MFSDTNFYRYINYRMPELDCKEDKTLHDQPYSICGALAVHAQKLIEQGEHRKLKDCLDLLATAY